MEKNIEDYIKDGLIITATTTEIFFALKTANVRPPKASLDAIDIMKLADKIYVRVLVKDYAVYKKWINEYFMAPEGFSMVRIPLGSLAAKWVTASSS